jgi:hypothetical protein
MFNIICITCIICMFRCREQVRYDYLETHLYLRCQTRLVNCRLACGSKVPFNLRVGHEESHCMNRHIECWQCKEQVMSKDITSHLHNTCSYRLILCSIGCGLMIEAHELEHHENEICRNYCKWNCGVKYGPLQARQLHELLQCSLREKRCGYGCSMDKYMSAGYVEVCSCYLYMLFIYLIYICYLNMLFIYAI